MKFLYRTAAKDPRRLALLPGAWNPPTTAHVAMARAALQWADEVVFVIPQALPHKEFEGVSFADRARMIAQAAAREPRVSAAITESGYYFEMAAEAHASVIGPHEIGLICGRDAAERIAGWDYGRSGVFEEMLARHPLLVASRSGLWQQAEGYGDRVVTLKMEPGFDLISSTEVRRRVAAAEDWMPLVPESIHNEVARLYGGRG